MNDLIVLCASLLLVGAIVWFRQLKQRERAKVDDTPLSSPTSDKRLFAPSPTDRSFGGELILLDYLWLLLLLLLMCDL